MSTAFYIIPTDNIDITFGQVIEISERHINTFLNSVGIEQSIELKVNLHENSEIYVKEIQMTDKFEWSKDEYVWFAIKGLLGGTDAYCSPIYDSDIDPENPWWILNDLESESNTIENIKEKLKNS